MTEGEKNYQLVKVFVRQRPFTKNENALYNHNIVQHCTSKEITVRSGSTEKKYNFDGVFGANSSQDEIYEAVVYPLIDFIISGYNCTVFAYGQTGTGKTHTMVGSNIGPDTDFDNDPSIGMIPRAASHLFSKLSHLKDRIEYTVTISFIEIYNEEIRDLLARENNTTLRIFDDPENRGSICIKGLKETTVLNTSDVYKWLNIGTIERQTAQTNLNLHSSRSHTVFTLQVHTRETTKDGEEIIKTGKLYMTDLAGSENIGKSGATDIRAREAGTINKSLLTLGKVIKALARKMQHIPYRESKLTRILQDSLGGKTKTCMIATFTPCSSAWDETVSTLDYAYEARSVANCPQININRRQLNVLKEMKQEMHKLRQELAAARSGEGFYITKESYEEINKDISKKNERISDMSKSILCLNQSEQLIRKQYDEINQSFLTTKEYLEKVRSELEEKTLQVKQNDYMINYMQDRNQEMKNTANLLWKVCETSTKHEDIYHKKYQYLCDTSFKNAKIADNVFSTSVNYLKEMEKTSENFNKSKELQVNNLKKNLHSLEKSHFGSLEELRKFLIELQTCMSNPNLEFNKILQNDGLDYSTTNIPNYINAIFYFCNSSQLQKYVEIKNAIDLLKNNILSKSKEITSKSEQCVTSIEHQSIEEKEFFKINERIFQLSETLYKQHHNNEKQKLLEEENFVLKQHLSMIKKYSSGYLKELTTLKDLTLEIQKFIQKYEQKKHLSATKYNLCDFQESLTSAMQIRNSIMDDTLDTAEKSEIDCKEQILSDKSKLEGYFTGFIGTFKNRLQFYNLEMKNAYYNLANRSTVIKNNLLESTLQHKQETDSTVENMTNLTSTHTSDTMKFIHRSTEHVETLEKSVVSKAHFGDTPVKVIYDYPKRIEERIPRETLIQQFSRNNQS